MLQHPTVPTEEFHALLGRLFKMNAPSPVMEYMDSMLHTGWGYHNQFEYEIAQSGHIPSTFIMFASSFDEFRRDAEQLIADGVTIESATERYAKRD